MYVGDNVGSMQKFTGVFKGTPAIAAAPWPVTVAAGVVLTSPVYVQGAGKIIVAGDAQAVYSVNAATGAVITSAALASGLGIDFVDAPIVDSTNGQIYLFAGRLPGGASAEVFQIGVGFAGGGGATNSIALGTQMGILTIHITQPARDSCTLVAIPAAVQPSIESLSPLEPWVL
jgi:hypothetical protein